MLIDVVGAVLVVVVVICMLSVVQQVLTRHDAVVVKSIRNHESHAE